MSSYVCWILAILFAVNGRILGHGDLDIRITELSARILTNAANARLLLERGELHRLHQDWPAAKADLDRAAVLDSGLVAVGLARARLLADSGEVRSAKLAYDSYLACATNDGVALIERARVSVKLDELEAAFADYNRGVTVLTEPLPDYFLERADVALRCGRREEAIAGLDEGLRRLGVIVVLQIKAIELELENKNFDAALRRLETIRARANRQELWLERQGQILRQAGRESEARLALEASLRAVAKLPARLQATESMELLKARVLTALGELALTNPPAAPSPNH